jgi:hypothetical protein
MLGQCALEAAGGNSVFLSGVCAAKPRACQKAGQQSHRQGCH